MRISLAPGALAACLLGLAAPALAATAHNSQAGSWGPNSRQCAAMPYFRAGGCASAALIDDRRYPFTLGAQEPDRPVGPGRARPAPWRRLIRPGRHAQPGIHLRAMVDNVTFTPRRAKLER